MQFMLMERINPELLATSVHCYIHTFSLTLIHMALHPILMAMERILWRQHKNHYEQMCVIFMAATKFTLAPSQFHLDRSLFVTNRK